MRHSVYTVAGNIRTSIGVFIFRMSQSNISRGYASAMQSRAQATYVRLQRVNRSRQSNARRRGYIASQLCDVGLRLNEFRHVVMKV